MPESNDTILDSSLLTRHQEILQLLETILIRAVEMMNADRGVVLLTEDDQIRNVASYPHIDETTGLVDVSSSYVRTVLETGKPQLVFDAPTDLHSQSASVRDLQITSILCVPIHHEAQVVGAIYLDSRRNRQKFTEDNLVFVRNFASMAATALDYAVEYHTADTDRRRLRSELELLTDFTSIIGKSPKMHEVFGMMKRVMNSDISVMLEGESGTGKELVARAIHYHGPRRDKPFVAQFCGNLAEALLESELFGHKKGAFTGAVFDKKGLFEVADGGTFFLDEIADISPTIQSKLLRVLQEGEIRRVGDTESRRVNVRIISATNRNLRTEVETGKFREDLFYRLNVITVTLPPLRDRTGDIDLLVQHFLKQFAVKNDVPVKRISKRGLQALTGYHWPGNVRELENTIERAMILSEGDVIDVGDLLMPSPSTAPGGHNKTLKDQERDIVLHTLQECNDNKTRTAEILGVSLRWLHYKLNEWKNQPK
jgi:Nif-specific regulatory protein